MSRVFFWQKILKMPPPPTPHHHYFSHSFLTYNLLFPSLSSLFRTITVVVKSRDGEEIKFKIKRITKFIKVLNEYCKKVGAAEGTYWFMFDGERVQSEDTADSLGLEE